MKTPLVHLSNSCSTISIINVPISVISLSSTIHPYPFCLLQGLDACRKTPETLEDLCLQILNEEEQANIGTLNWRFKKRLPPLTSNRLSELLRVVRELFNSVLRAAVPEDDRQTLFSLLLRREWPILVYFSYFKFHTSFPTHYK